MCTCIYIGSMSGMAVPALQKFGRRGYSLLCYVRYELDSKKWDSRRLNAFRVAEAVVAKMAKAKINPTLYAVQCFCGVRR